MTSFSFFFARHHMQMAIYFQPNTSSLICIPPYGFTIYIMMHPSLSLSLSLHVSITTDNYSHISRVCAFWPHFGEILSSCKMVSKFYANRLALWASRLPKLPCGLEARTGKSQLYLDGSGNYVIFCYLLKSSP
jgi:hypothetical protein